MSALFSKEKTNKKVKDKAKDEPKNVEAAEVQEEQAVEAAGSSSFTGSIGAGAHRILQGFYVSEKSSLGNMNDQYMFRVFKNANKAEIKKEVAKLFNVKVKSVKVLNMPEKRRDFGRHPGSRSGFKKAVVVLEKGYSIGQAKP